MAEKVDILAIGAHPDDIELSAGGTIAKHVSEGKKVAIVDLTEGELGSRGTVRTRYDESSRAAEILGVSFRENTRLPDGFFSEDKESLVRLIRQIRHFQPEIVLANAPADRHPDHGRAASFISRACFLSGLLKIETVRDDKIQEKWRPKAVYHFIQDRYLSPDFLVDVTAYKDQKMEAIKAYESQFYKPGMKGPVTPISGIEFMDYLESRMIHFGRLINVKYAEGFIVERTPGVNSLFDLL
ncbi:MAG: bacillithiol biosynthesis deacetylase BshB1 [Brumimicrobium sp.]|nr:bacillithiol biosynthesis deacetylase BshB1 [Brumimicrobium sp.]